MAELLATYRDPEAARKAITTLERHGVDANDIHLLEAPGAHAPKTDEAMREPDMAVTRTVFNRAAAVSIATAVLVGAVGAVVGWFASDGQSLGALLGGVGGFIAGGLLGMLWGGYSGIAVSEEWSDTFEAHGPTTLAVTVADDHVIDLRDRIETTRPESIKVS